MVPMSIFTTLVAASWAADPSALQDRLSITLNMLLTGVAFKYSASQGLPKIAYVAPCKCAVAAEPSVLPAVV